MRPSGRPEIGGFRSGTKMVVESQLFDHTEFALCACTHKEDGAAVARFMEDRRRFRAALSTHRDHGIVMMQVGQYRSIYREYAIARMARRAGRRLVCDVRAGSVLEFLDRDSSALERALFRGVVQASDLCLLQCAAFVPELGRRYPSVHFEWFANFVPSAEIRPRSVPPYRNGERLRAVYFGHYSEGKGVGQAVEAVSQLRRERGIQVELHLAGEVRDEATGRALAAADPELVIDHGLLAPEALWELLRTTHVFVFPTSHWGEGHTNAVNEALMCGLAIVATPHQHLPDILPRDETLWLDSERLVDSIAERLAELAEDPERVNRLAEVSQRHVRQNFTDERWIPFLEARFDALAAGETLGAPS
jgi:glycosyltransferase involved in cell wall biosynthesis